MLLIDLVLPQKMLNKAMLKFITFICFGIIYSLPLNAASLIAQVDRQTLSIDETLTLKIISDQRINSHLDLSALDAQFDIINRQKNTQASVVNGNVTVSTGWSLILAPKESGQLLIPSFNIKGIYSEAIKIDVTDNPAPASIGNNKTLQGDIILQASINKNKVYVQEQILLTLSLYYKTALSGYTAEDLVIENVTLEAVSEDSFQKNIGGVAYNVLEKVYAIHPQFSGSLNIPQQTWQVEKSINRFGFGRSTSPYLRVRSRPQTIEVKARPDDSLSQHWLPASNVTLDQNWQQSILTAKVGEPLNYSITMSADGLGFSQLPTLPLTSDNFTIYTEQAKTNNITNRKGILGTRTDNYAIIPKETGTFSLPETRLTWWDINEDKEKTIILPEQVIIVSNSALAQQTQEIPSIPSIPSNSTTAAAKNTQSLTWVITTVIFAVFALFFLVAWLRLKHSIANNNKTIAEDNATTRAVNVKQLYRNMGKAIDDQQWGLLKQLLNDWGREIIGEDTLSNADIKQRLPSLTPMLDSLDLLLYSSSAGTQKLEHIIKHEDLIAQLKALTNSKEKSSNSSPLKALY